MLGLPLASGWLAGLPQDLAALPPIPGHLDPPEFSAPVYIFFAILGICAVLFLSVPGLFGLGGQGSSDFKPFDWAVTARRGGSFPARGWIGLALIAVSWPVAWTHPDWLGPVADHTFFPLWLGYILTVDAATWRRAGDSPLARAGVTWLIWFPASAAAWWYFELLNRFIQTWAYVGVAEFSPLRYVLGSTLAFSTVIPAVLTTAALLSTFGCFRRRFVRTARGSVMSEVPRAVWWWVVAAGVIGLVLMPWFPIPLFALIWIAPWLVVAGLLEHGGRDTGLGHLLRGDWGPAVTLATAALVCGFFWELWNVYAMPKWVYQIPWVNRFELFEMPLVGYLGYLPFGPACWAFWLLLMPAGRRSPARSH